ncbi:hypothetical protein HDU79_002768 [Rhizoclosmatium sp. JEL0117]|nr:hypothetical protein HDU79_002768 [Rhizoclosmatium sp. JEL0117]
MIDRLAYFKDILPAIQSRSLPPRIPSPQEVRNIKGRALYRHLKSDGSKRKYKLAYLLMIHGDITTMPDVRQLIEELDDGSAVFLIHVDKKSEDLKAAVIDMITSREKALKSQLKKTNGEINSWDPTDVPGNVFMTSKSYEISWGHGSLMWCQLNGFWELLDLAEWEYVINLSASDYPLRKSREIAHILSQPKYKGRNHMDSWHVNTALAKRLLPFLHLKSPMFAEITVRHIDELGVMLPPFPRWTYVKHHQWMILTREFIEFLRSSDTVAHAFAYFEHTLVIKPLKQILNMALISWIQIPDESFLGSVLKSFPQFKKKLSSSKRYVKWLPKQPHPEVLGLEAAEVLFAANRNATDPKYLFARKIDSQSAEGRELLDWIRREQIMNNTRNDDEYDMMEGVLFVPN